MAVHLKSFMCKLMPFFAQNTFAVIFAFKFSVPTFYRYFFSGSRLYKRYPHHFGRLMAHHSGRPPTPRPITITTFWG